MSALLNLFRQLRRKRKDRRDWRRDKIDNPAPVRHRSSKKPLGKTKSERLRNW